MKIDPITSNSANPAASAPDSTFKNEFMRLLVAQLEHQNPLDPQSGAEFVAQLAQFASVEQGAQTNALLAGLQAEQRAASGASLAAFIGTTATVHADAIEWTPGRGDPPELLVDVRDPANSVEVTIYDEFGDEVRRIELGPLAAGETAIGWDGTDTRGVAVPAGSYRIEVTATGADGSTVTADPKLRGVVDAIEFADGYPLLRIGNATVTPASVVSIGN